MHQDSLSSAAATVKHRISPALLGLSAFVLGIAIDCREGLFSLTAVAFLTLSIVACLLALGPDRRLANLSVVILTCALAIQFAQLYRDYPGTIWNTRAGDPRQVLSGLKDQHRYVRRAEDRAGRQQCMNDIEASLRDPLFRMGILVAAGLSALSLLQWRMERLRLVRWACRWVLFPLLLCLHFLLGTYHLRKTPEPHIDVFVFQQEASAALLRGENPYAITFTNISGPDAYVYGPGLTRNGKVNFGFPYPPLSLFMALPGYLMAGDHRYAQLAAIVLAAALLAYARPGIFSTLAALLLLFTPRVFMIAELAWTEPFVVLLLCATVFCACRLPRLTPYVLGLLFASKQYSIFAAPLAVLLMARPFQWKPYLIFMSKAAAVAAAVSLPLVLWDLPAFIHSAVTLQLKQPFRKDALSYPALVAWQLSEPLAIRMTFLAFVAAAGGIVYALKRCPRGPAGFAMGMAMVYLGFLVFNKQAFCNYYFFVLGTLCCGLACGPQDHRHAVVKGLEQIVRIRGDNRTR
jgi:hypothetical protein